MGCGYELWFESKPVSGQCITRLVADGGPFASQQHFAKSDSIRDCKSTVEPTELQPRRTQTLEVPLQRPGPSRRFVECW